MKILSIDTSSKVASVAIMDEQKLICEYTINHKMTHSQRLMPIIKEVLQASDLEISDIDLFAVAIGPGSFTGIRIGVATAKALAHSYNKPIIGINTLDMLALGGAYFDGIICPIIDARNNQVYTSLYSWESDQPKIISEYIGIDMQELMAMLKEKKEKVIFMGDGVLSFKQCIIDTLKEQAFFTPIYNITQNASKVAQSALYKFNKGIHDDFLTLTPFYLRKTQAERMLEDKI